MNDYQATEAEDLRPVPLSESEKKLLQRIKVMLASDNINHHNDLAYPLSNDGPSKTLNLVKLKQDTRLLPLKSRAKELIMAEPDELPWLIGVGKIEIIAKILCEELRS